MVKVRKRDVIPPDPAARHSDVARLEKTIVDIWASDVVRLEKIIADIPATDLTALETKLREQTEEIAALKLLAMKQPKDKPSYVFDITKDAEGVISSVSARPVVQRRTIN